jgi:hypothetical protein
VPVTSFVHHLTETLLAGSSYESLSTTVGTVAVLLLLSLLLAKEVARTWRPGEVRAMRILDAHIVPLLPALAIIVVARLAQLL